MSKSIGIFLVCWPSVLVFLWWLPALRFNDAQLLMIPTLISTGMALIFHK